MKRRELIRRLQAAGCVLMREGGSHSIWLNPATGEREMVPRHTEINRLVATKILKSLTGSGLP